MKIPHEFNRRGLKEEQEEMHPCQRYKRAVKAQYKFCYHCHNYLKVKARIAMELSA
jgi:hypothetical protein